MAVFRGFRQFRKVADIVLKAPDVTVLAPEGASYQGGLGARSPRKFLKLNTQKRRFQRFWNPGISFPARLEFSLEFSLKSRGSGSGDWQRQCSVVYHCELIFLLIFKKEVM